MDVAAATQIYLLYVVMPLWLLVGLLDWLCHRRSNIETTSGWKESMIHLLMLGQVGAAILLALFFEINALVIGLMLLAFVAHEATAIWDLHYAWKRREVTPWEQHVHDYLAVIPFLAVSMVMVLHWPQALSLIGLGPAEADFTLRWKEDPLPVAYIATLLGLIALLELLPYGEELLRGLRARSRASEQDRRETRSG